MKRSFALPLATAVYVIVLAMNLTGQAGQDRPAGFDVNINAHRTGNPVSGREVFRFETFGNEGFWTDALRLPQGVVAARITPLQALLGGMHVDSDGHWFGRRRLAQA